ncbi:hypothetical protein BC941DRAFT_21032 [Chlamydoabsidia padenii]|nr:hypothetical protein BC941DRAFT_21032 [Chlamydoabsidia padenii]
MKAIVKLPPKNRQSIALQNNNKLPQTNTHLQDNRDDHRSYLVSDRLYVQVPNSIAECDIFTMLQTCCPQEIHLTCQPYPELSTGYITFPNKYQADLAFTLFNGAHFSNGVRLSLYINPLDKGYEPEPLSDILQVQHLPMDSTNQSIYDLFRSFGPMALCKIIVEQGPTAAFDGTALVQYYHTEDADHAISVMNNKVIQEKMIVVFPFVFSKRHEPNTDMELSQDKSNNDDTSSVDYTNLYIKNLDLNAKSSDLFKHFRKYGHIISARVMKNARTNQSKGFGFVSFIKAEEAYRALHGMNGRYILSKAILVAFHEPKKARGDRSTTTESNGTCPSNTTSTLSHMASSYSPPTPQTKYQPPSPVYQQQQQSLHRSNQSPKQSQHHASHQNITPTHPQQHYRPMPPSSSEGTATSRPLYNKPLSLKMSRSATTTMSIGSISERSINGYHTPQPNDYNGVKIGVNPTTEHGYTRHPPPSLSTLASGASIKTTPSYKTTSNGRPTLRRRGSIESMCSVMTETSNHTQRQRMMTAVMSTCGPDLASDIVDMLLTLRKKERSLCLFNADFLKSKVEQAKIALDTFEEDASKDDIDTFLNSLDGLKMHEKKQKLGDRLFPLVKATGIKQAPKITIRLLDHVPLHDLAHLMYVESDLRIKIGQVTSNPTM